MSALTATARLAGIVHGVVVQTDTRIGIPEQASKQNC